MAYTALSELTASMGSAYQLVIRPSYEQDVANNLIRMRVSYGVRKVGANSGTYNLDAARMWASFGSVAVLGSGGTHINWDMRKDSVGTYREYASYSGTVYCNSDGTSSIYLYAYFDVGNVSAAKDAEISRTISLPRVPRPSTISATPTMIGQATTITIQRASPTFTHTVHYAYSAFWDIIGTEKRSDTIFTWVVPTDFYHRLWGKSITVTLTCDTYEGDTHIGETSCEFTATVPEAPNIPSLTDCTVADTNFFCTPLEGEGNLIRYRSVVRLTCMAEAKNYAYIESLTVNGQEMVLGSFEDKTTGTGLISNVDTGTFVFVATDTRGFTTSVTKTMTLVPYEVVTMSYTWARTSSVSSTVNLTMNGRFYNGSFGLKSNTLTVEVKVKRSDTDTWGTANVVTTTKSGNTWKGTLQLSGLSYDYSYDVWILAYDAFGADSTSKAESIFTIPPGAPVFHWGKNDFTLNKRLYARGSIRVPFGDSSGSYGLFASSQALNGTAYRMIAMGKTGESDVLWIGSTSAQTGIMGGPLYLYFENNSGGICFRHTNGSYYNAAWVNSSNRLFLGNTTYATTVQGSSLQLGSASYSTYIYGSYLYIYIPNSKGGINVQQKAGGSQTALWINSADEVILGSTVLVTRLCGTTIYATTNITVSSDRAKKKAIEPLTDAYERLLDKIEPQRFHYQNEADNAPYHLGYVAQDVLAALEDVGLERKDLAAVAGEDGDLGIAYAELVPLLHKKIKSLEDRVERLESLVAKLLNSEGASDTT